MPKNHSTQPHEFREALQQIPNLIVEEIRRNTESMSRKESEKVARIYHSPAHSRKWLLIGVITCSLTILGFWFLYISELIEENKSTLNPAKTFTDSEDTSLSNLVSTFSALEDGLRGSLTSPTELKAMVADAILPLLSTSSTVTTTQSTTTSSTIVSTTTTP